MTRLPGNSLIAQYIGDELRDQKADRVFVYFDLDNFKVFNDVYGFRQGDQPILLLADTIREAAHGRDVFLGHIGGDDLFAGFGSPDWKLTGVCGWAMAVVEKFNQAVLSFFSAEDRARGHIFAADRSGVEKEVPLLSVSCAVLALPSGSPALSPDSLGAAIARCKREAKRSPDKVHVSSLGDDDYPPSGTESKTLDQFVLAVDSG